VWQIRRRILDGRLNPGVRLPSERVLASEFEVSRTTVREAVRTLSSDGLVAVRQGSGNYAQRAAGTAVSRSLNLLLELEQTSVREVLELRLLVERYIADCLASRITARDFEECARLADAIDLATNTTNAFAAVRDFHVGLAAATGNRFLAAVSGLLIDLLLDAQSAALRAQPDSFWIGRFRRSQPFRLRLLNSLREHDRERAIDAMTAYHRQLRRGFWADGAMPIRPSREEAM